MEKRFVPYSRLCDLAFVYCMGKNFLFRLFFGWRASNEKGCTFILSKRAWCELEDFIHKEDTINAPTVEQTPEKWVPLRTRPMDEDERKDKIDEE